jgi:hypothetical protein
MKQLGSGCVLVVVCMALCARSIDAADTWTSASNGNVDAYAASGGGAVRDALSLLDRTHAFLAISIADFGKTPVGAVTFSDDLPVENRPVAPAVAAEVVTLTGAAVAQTSAGRDAITLADTVSVTGRIRNIICSRGGAELTLEVVADGKTLRLFVDDKLKIIVYGKPKETVNLTCGEQNVPIKVSYKPRVDKKRETIGYVRVLDYRQ